MSKKITISIILIGCLLTISIANVNALALKSDKKQINSQDSFESLNGGIDWWPMFKHDSTHCGYSNSNIAPAPFGVLWNYSTNGEIYSSPSVVNNKNYIGSNDDYLYCLSTESYDELWKYKTDDDVKSTPAVYENKVYFGSRDKYVYCLNADTGIEIWKFKTDGFVYSSPTVFDDKIYIGSQDGYLYCLNPDTGSAFWSFKYKYEDYSIFSSPAVVDGNVFFSTVGKANVFCLDAQGNGDGTTDMKWIKTIQGYSYSSPCVANDKVYVGSDDEYLYCFDTDTGNEIWKFKTGGAVRSTPSFAYGNIYVGSDDGKIYCLNAENGQKIWSFLPLAGGISSPIIVDGKVYFGAASTINPNIYCVNADTGHVLSRMKIGGMQSTASPAFADEKLYIGSDDGKIYCLTQAPNTPTINGPTNGKIKTTYSYSFCSEHLYGHELYYYINWGDGTNTGWIGPYSSGEEITKSKSWDQGSYDIKAKAKDEYGVESDWASLKVTMPRKRSANSEEGDFNKLFFYDDIEVGWWGSDIVSISIKPEIQPHPFAFPKFYSDLTIVGKTDYLRLRNHKTDEVYYSAEGKLVELKINCMFASFGGYASEGGSFYYISSPWFHVGPRFPAFIYNLSIKVLD